MIAPVTAMATEIAQIPHAARRLCTPKAQADLKSHGAWLRGRDPACIVTIARGSSDHAATCLKYAIEITSGVPVASVGPSIASIYNAALQGTRVAGLAISQSGGSQDIVALTQSLTKGGGDVLALTNTQDSPLAQAATLVFDIQAGPENAVAATKSFCNSVLAGLWTLAHWQNDLALMDQLHRHTDLLETAPDRDISPLVDFFTTADQMFVLGRGPSLGLAQEVALKAMEVCNIPAIAYSSAEVLHGPSAIVKAGFPVLALGANHTQGLGQTLNKLRAQGGHIVPTPNQPDTGPMGVVPNLLELMDIYRAMEQAARAKGLQPDKPAYLKKITNTV